MKKILVFPTLLVSTLCALVMTCVVSAQLTGSLTNGLVGEWRFDGNGNDSSPSTNHAVVGGADFVPNRFGNSNSALAITQNAGGAFSQSNIGISGNAARTISYWTKFATQGSSSSYTQSAIWWGENSGVGSRSLFSQESGGNLWFNGAWADIDVKSPSDLPSHNTWRLVTFTYNDSLGSAAVYVNGIAQTNLALGTHNAVGWSGSLNTIDTPVSMSGSVGDFVDDVTIYNRALSSTEVAALYSAQSIPILTPEGDEDSDGVTNYRETKDGTNPNDANSYNPLSKGLVAYYPFDGNANDESGFGNNGSAINLSYTNGRSAHLGNSAYFDGSAGVNVPESQSLNLPSNFSISLWINVATWDGYNGNNGHPILAAGGVPNVAEVAFGCSLAEWSSDFWLVGANDYPANSSYYLSRAYSPTANFNDLSNLEKLKVLPGEWRKLTWTYDGNTIRSYLDGEMLQPASYSNSANISPYLGWGTLRIGFNHGNQHLRGALDEFRIYNRALMIQPPKTRRC